MKRTLLALTASALLATSASAKDIVETAVDAGRMVGRVEHVVSRKVSRFQSLDELVAFMTAVLREAEETTRPSG